MSTGVYIYDNQDKQQPYRPVRSEGALNIDSPSESLKGDLEGSLKASPDSLTGTIVALRYSKNGKYVRLDDEYLSADSTSTHDSEKFHLINVEGGVALKSVLTKNYIGITRSTIFSCGEPEVKCGLGWNNYNAMDERARFKMECDDNGGWSFKAKNGNYLSVADWGTIRTGPKETFQIEIQDEPIQKAIGAIGPGGTPNLKEGVYRGTVTIDRSVNIIGMGSGRTVVDGDKKCSVLTVGKTNSDTSVKLTGITIQGGSSEYGAGINNFGRLTLDDSTITGNIASNSGGGVYNHDGIVDMINGVIKDNIAAYGGGIFNHGMLNLHMGGIINNTALGRGSVEAGKGGGIWDEGTFNFKAGYIYNNQPDDIYRPP